MSLWALWRQGQIALAFGMLPGAEGKLDACWMEEEKAFSVWSLVVGGSMTDEEIGSQVMEDLEYPIAVLGKLRIISIPFLFLSS